MRTRPLSPLLAGALLIFAPRVANAADVILDHLPPSAIKFDGKIKEWPGTTSADVTIKAGKAKATFVAGYDDAGVWIGAEVEKDGGIVAGDDCVSLVIAFPKTGVSKGVPELSAYEVGFFPGVPGASAGVVKMKSGGAAIAGSKIIEAPRKAGGYTMEGFVPWSAFAEAKKTRAGLRGAIRAYDSGGGIKATSSGSADATSSLGFLMIEPEQSLPAAFASRKLTWKDVAYEVNADLAGDATNERALFVGRALFVMGPTYKEGKQWLSMDLGADVVSVESKDVTGDGHADLLITARVKNGGVTREGLHVFSLMGTKGAETPTHVFGHETLIDGGGGKVLRDVVTFAGKKATITYATPKGWDATSWDQPMASDLDPILLPWGTVKERSFVFSGSAFSKDKEVTQKGTAPPPTTTNTLLPTTTVAPPIAKGDPAAAALAQYRKDKGLPPDTPDRFEAVVTIGAGKKGRAALFGRDLVVTSNDGTYAYVSMARFAADKDVYEVTAKDLTGDGREELIVRGVVRAKLTGGSGGDKEVAREILTIYAPKTSSSGMSLISVFTAEVARSIGASRVEAQLRIITAKGNAAGKIELSKGSATGWTATTYPFTKESPTPGVEPLVLPWGKETVVTYSWDGEKFSR